jgi:hypothetical protein
LQSAQSWDLARIGRLPRQHVVTVADHGQKFTSTMSTTSQGRSRPGMRSSRHGSRRVAP